MNTLDTQLDAVIAILRAAGGVVGIEPGAPEEVKRAFLELLLSDPRCRKVLMGRHEGHEN